MEPTTLQTSIEAMVNEFSTSITGVDYTLLLQPMIQIFPTVFTILLALAGVNKAIGFVRSILGA